VTGREGREATRAKARKTSNESTGAYEQPKLNQTRDTHTLVPAACARAIVMGVCDEASSGS
jgi:hypothetical protein